MQLLDPLDSVRRSVRHGIEQAIGTHDQVEIYGGPAGDPGLCGPHSMSWELHSDMGAVAAAGLGAIIFEVLLPPVMAGVAEQSGYRTHTERRARNTFGYVMVSTFGNTAAATAMVKRVHAMHERVVGTMPNGATYQASDPELLAWVHTAIPLAIMTAYDRYTRPLSVDEKNRYLAEQAVIGKLGGATDIPVTVSQLNEYLEAMRPRMAVNEQFLAFVDFMCGLTGDKRQVGALGYWNRRLAMHASMSLLPDWAQRLSGLSHNDVAQRYWFDPATRLHVNLIRWSYGVPDYRRLAEQRLAARPAVESVHGSISAGTRA